MRDLCLQVDASLRQQQLHFLEPVHSKWMSDQSILLQASKRNHFADLQIHKLWSCIGSLVHLLQGHAGDEEWT